MALARSQEWLSWADFACPMASFMAIAAVHGGFCPSANSGDGVGLDEQIEVDPRGLSLMPQPE